MEEIGEVFGKRFGAKAYFSVTGNVSKYVGLKFDLSAHSKTENVTFEGDQFELKGRLTNYLGGIQVKNNLKDGPRVSRSFTHSRELPNRPLRSMDQTRSS